MAFFLEKMENCDIEFSDPGEENEALKYFMNLQQKLPSDFSNWPLSSEAFKVKYKHIAANPKPM